MRKRHLVLALVSLVLSIIVFIFADGSRAIYSGSFFLMLAAVLALNGRQRE